MTRASIFFARRFLQRWMDCIATRACPSCERFACIVTHRRAGKTVACIQDLQHAAVSNRNVRSRYAYLSPFLKQSKTVAWDYLRATTAPLRKYGATVHESEL